MFWEMYKKWILFLWFLSGSTEMKPERQYGVYQEPAIIMSIYNTMITR